jgi:hypothetical protein
MSLSSDTLTSLIGGALGVLHQVGLVGVIPQTRADWINTGASASIIVLGYLINKPSTR